MKMINFFHSILMIGIARNHSRAVFPFYDETIGFIPIGLSEIAQMTRDDVAISNLTLESNRKHLWHWIDI